MIWFFLIFLTIYSVINYYIGLRGWQALEGATYLRPAFLVIFLISSLFVHLANIKNFYTPEVIFEPPEIHNLIYHQEDQL